MDNKFCDNFSTKEIFKKIFSKLKESMMWKNKLGTNLLMQKNFFNYKGWYSNFSVLHFL